tara:strand:- start:222 stop:416 length:195 start_codon:yes stop_codon:yes gene_type:complete
VKTNGDALLAKFASVIKGVQTEFWVSTGAMQRSVAGAGTLGTATICYAPNRLFRADFCSQGGNL